MIVLKTLISIVIGFIFGFLLGGAVYRFVGGDASIFIAICGAVYVFWKICPTATKNWIKKWNK